MIDYDASIERLKDVPVDHSSYAIATAFMGNGSWSGSDFRDALIELLRTARDSVLLPKDVNGEVIHMGDRLQRKLDLCNWSKPFEICGMAIDIESRGWEVYDKDGVTYMTTGCRHYNEPTIDDVLREFANKVYATHYVGVHMSIDEIIEAYAKRLELKEEA